MSHVSFHKTAVALWCHPNSDSEQLTRVRGIGFDSSGRQKQAKMIPGWSVIGKTESLTKTFNFHSWQLSEFVATELLS